MANYVKFKQGFSKDFNTTNQPLTNGMIYFVVDENNHGSIYYDTVLDGSKNNKNGATRRIKFAGLPVEITGSVIGKGEITTDGSKIVINTNTNHSHGLMHQNFTVSLPNNTNEEWNQLGSANNASNSGGFWLKSIRGQSSAPKWFLGDYSAGIAFGGSDTKGVISVAYHSPKVRFAGGNGTKPVWNFTITGTADKTYNLNDIGGLASSAQKLHHTVTFKIQPIADQTKGNNGVKTDLSGSEVNLSLCARLSGFENIQATRFQGNADSATWAGYAKSLYLNPTSRPTNLDYNMSNAEYDKKVSYSLASSVTTTGKPSIGDSGVLTFGWDTATGWGAQLAININKGAHLAVRGASDASGKSEWGTWATVLDSSNYQSYVNNYYWANVKVSTSSNANTKPTFGEVTVSGWIQSSSGSTGWINSAHGGGIYMSDNTWVRVYGSGKKFYVAATASDAIYTSGGVKASNGFNTDGTISIKPQNNSEINFGGTNNSGTIYIGYRATDSRPIPSKYIFGTGAGGSATIAAQSGWLGFKYFSSDNWIGWYGTRGDTGSTRYGYIQNDVSANGTMRFVREQGGNFTFNSHIYPSSTNAYDLGGASLAWRTLHVQNISLYGQTANRLVWTNGSKAIKAANHFANESKIAINYTGEPSFNLYVNGNLGVTSEARLGRNRILNSSSVEASEPLINALGFKGAGYPIYTDPDFASGTNSVQVYNNAGSGTVTITRTQSSNSGNSSGQILAIKHTGAASPGHGGFYQNFTGRANAVFIQIFRAKVPVGYTLELGSNSLGTNYADQWLTNNSGTGKWEWYARRVICGKEGNFSTSGYIFLANGTAPTASAPVTWYLSYANVYDVTKGNYDGLRTRYSDAATYSADDTNTPIKDRFIAKIEVVDSNGSTFAFQGRNGIGAFKDNKIVIPAASSSNAGLITNTTQTIAGAKTFANAATFNSTINALGEVKISNNITFANISTGIRGITGTIANNDFWRVVGGSTETDQGYLEIATADGATEPIYVRQYQGSFATIKRTLTLLDGSGNTYIPGTLYDKNVQELRAELFVASLKTKTSNINTYSFIGCNTVGIELSKSLITIPLATTDKAGLVSGEAQSFGGNKTWYGQHVIHKEGTSANLKSSTLRLSSVPKSSSDDSYGAGDVGLEFWRGGNASWQIVNTGGNLIFKNNYTSAKESTYKNTSLKLNYNTGLASAPYISVNGENTGYRFYVNGTSYFNGNTVHNGYVDLTQAFSLRRVGYGSSWNLAHQRAMIIMSTANGFSPLLAQKTSSGWWTMAHYTETAYKDNLLFGFLADTNAGSSDSNKNYLSTILRMKNIGGDRMFVTADNDSNKGSSTTKPVYIDSSGRVNACTYELKSTVQDGIANRAAYYTSARTIEDASSIFMDSTHLGVNTSGAATAGSLTFNFTVIGHSYFGGTTYVQKDFNIRGNESTDNSTHLNFLASDNTVRATIAFNGNTASDTSYLRLYTRFGHIRLNSAAGYISTDSDLRFPFNKGIVQLQAATSNATTAIKWLKGGTSQNTYDPQIGQHNTGGTNSTGAIYIVPYATATRPWEQTVGLYITKDVLKLDGKRISTTGNDTGNVGNNAQFIYSSNGVLYGSTATIGSATQPVFLRSGTIVACTYSLKANLVNGTAGRMAYYSANDSVSAAGSIYTDGATIGIGGSNTGYKLYVNGTSYFTGAMSFANNIGITGTMAGGSDSWGIVGTGTNDAGRLKIFVTDNAITDWLDFEFRDYSGEIYTPLAMTGNKINAGATINVTKNNTYNLGASGMRWARLYLGSTDSYGSATRPIYWNNGIPTPTTYSLNATLAAGTTNHLAYYSGANNVVSTPSIYTNGNTLSIGELNTSYKLYVVGTTWLKGLVWTKDLKPDANNTSVLGDSSYRWKNAYINTVYGNLSGDVSGNAATATKLKTARRITLDGAVQGSASFDGSGDITIQANHYYCNVSGNNTSNYPWRRIATVVAGTGQYADRGILLRIHHMYQGGGEGLIKIALRTNATGGNCGAQAQWLYRYGISVDNIAIAFWGTTGQNVYADVYYKVGTWPRCVIENVSNRYRFTLLDSSEASDTTTSDKKGSYEAYASIAAGGTEIHGQAYTSIVYASDVVSAKVTPRTFTIGNTSRQFDGTANVKWTIAEIGAVNKAGDTMTGALNFKNTTWNKVGDDAQFGDNDTAGSFAIQGLNGATNLKMVTYNNTSYSTITWNGSNFIFSNRILAQDIPSSWINGLKAHATYQISACGDSNSYHPWIQQTNNGSGYCFSLGMLGTNFYMIGCPTSQTQNSYTASLIFNVSNGYLQGCSRVYGAVWNDYAEYRKTDDVKEPGRVVVETGFGSLILSTSRLQPGANIISDTFGFAIGETQKAKTPIAVSGRVLAYPYEDKNIYKPGDAVCTGPNGTISKMTREEIMMYPERIVGTVSEIPDYETWGEEDVKVNGRIWIKVK